MPPIRPTRRSWRVPLTAAVAVAAALLASSPASAVRIMNWNLLNWSASSAPARVPYMQAIVRNAAPDLVVSQEVIDQTAVDLFTNSVVGAWQPGEWAAAPFVNGYDTDNSLWYRTSKFTLLDRVQIPTDLRDASRYHLRLVGYSGAEAELYIYSFHLKASTGASNEAQRLVEMQAIRANAETLPLGAHVLFCGDYNVYTGSEACFQYALSSVGSNIGRMKDPINQVGPWHDNPAYIPIFTQSPRTASFGGGSTGGMDDRFDFILESYNLDDGQGLDLLESTYKAYGNDGQHWNVAINAPPTNSAIGQLLADSLMNASDHLPVVADLSVPAKIDLPVAAVDFGTVIVGAVAGYDLPVSNIAQVPGDVLDYTLSAPAGFTAPLAALTLAAGASTTQPIGMETAGPGAMSGGLEVFSDDPDHGYLVVGLAGTVLAHAVPSTDSLEVAVLDTLDFGEQEAGGFSDLAARVYNAGYGALQAPLAVAAATITGGAGRFALAEPFAAALVGLAPAAYDVHFEDAGATADSVYEATLTFSTADQGSLPGATARPDVAYLLRARLTSSTVAVDPTLPPPGVTVLFAPWPNPATGGRATLRFDLATAGRVQLALYDVRGRRVATVVNGERAAGSYTVAWNGRGSDGRAVASGVYFAQLVTAAGPSTQRFLFMR